MGRPPIKPFQLCDDIYWVGVNSAAPSHLIVTDCGLVLIDTATVDTQDELLANISSLGFDVRDVRHIIHSHAHFDHVGATNRIVELSGAKTYGGFGDADSFCGKNKILWAMREPPENEDEFYFAPDVLIHDGDKIKFGNIEMRFLETPGHTSGVISMLWNAHHNGVEYTAGMFGGAGQNSLTDEYLDLFSLPYSLRNDYVRSIDRLLLENVDIHIGNHPGNNSHVDKASRKTEDYNPFVAEKTWRPFLEKQKNALIEKYGL